VFEQALRDRRYPNSVPCIETGGYGSTSGDHLDQTCVVHKSSSKLYLPMRQSVAEAVAETDRSGQWYVVTADHPNDAYHQVRNLAAEPVAVVVDRARPAPPRPGACTHLRAGNRGKLGQRDRPISRAATDITTPWATPRSGEVRG